MPGHTFPQAFPAICTPKQRRFRSLAIHPTTNEKDASSVNFGLNSICLSLRVDVKEGAKGEGWFSMTGAVADWRRTAFWVAGGLSVLLLAAVLAFALRPTVPQTGFYAVNLSSYYNARLTNSTLEPMNRNSPNYLVGFPSGLNKFGGVVFDVRGILQLCNKDAARWRIRYPEKVEGIKIGRPFKLIHLLHGVGLAERENAAVAVLVLHYEDGTTRSIPILYGLHVRDWMQPETENPYQPGVVWIGSNPMAKQAGLRLRVYKTTLENPLPNIPVKRLDYVSTLSKCAPFLLGLSVE